MNIRPILNKINIRFLSSKKNVPLSHFKIENQTPLNLIIDNIKNKIIENNFYNNIEKNNKIDLLNELTNFELGRFLLVNKGLNGYWTNYILTYPMCKQNVNSWLEKKILTEFPSVLATQERFNIFLKINQTIVKENANLATMPSGLANEILSLNYRGITKINLFAIDIDSESLKHALVIAKNNNLDQHFHTICQDAWKITYKNKFDLLSCNGLTIYEQNDQIVKNLYAKIFQSLKHGGILVTSTITPPPHETNYKMQNNCEWDITKINKETLELQNIIFGDIIGVKWQVYRSTSLIKSMLLEVGFKEISISYDTAKIFPTITAKKPV